MKALTIASLIILIASNTTAQSDPMYDYGTSNPSRRPLHKSIDREAQSDPVYDYGISNQARRPLNKIVDLQVQEDGKIGYSNVFPVNATQSSILTSAVKWAAISLHQADGCCGLLLDREGGMVTTEGSYSIDLFLRSGYLYFTMIIEVQDEKIMISYTNLAHLGRSGLRRFEEPMLGKKRCIKEMNANLTNLVVSLLYAIENEPKG